MSTSSSSRLWKPAENERRLQLTHEVGRGLDDRDRTTRKQLKLERGGTVLKVGGRKVVAEPSTEYEQIYDRFAKLLRRGASEMDGSPLLLIADAFLLGARENVAEFHW